jgi:tetratricopeptide (TPR) repeat protein
MSDAKPPAGRQPIPPNKRKQLQQCFERGSQVAAKGDYDFATAMFTICVTGDPANVMYVKSLLANFTKKYNNNKKGSKLAAISGMGVKGTVKKCALAKDWPGVIKSGIEYLNLNPWDVGTLVDMSKACEQMECDEAQVEYMKLAIDGSPDDIEANRQAGRAFGRNGLFDQAVQCWLKVLKLKPDDEEGKRAIPNLQIERTIHKGGYEQAESTQDARKNKISDDDDDEARLTPIQRLERAIEKDPTQVEKVIELSDLYAREEKYAEAEKSLVTGIQASPGNIQLRERLEDVQIRFFRQQLEIAKKKAEAERTPKAIEIYNRLREELISKEIEIYASRTQRYPANLGFKFELATRLQRAKKIDEAISLLQECRSDLKRKGQVHMSLAKCFIEKKVYKLAMANYEHAVEAEGAAATEEKKFALYSAGTLAVHIKDLDKAEKYLSELANLDYGYKDVSKWLDKLAQLREDEGSAPSE